MIINRIYGRRRKDTTKKIIKEIQDEEETTKERADS